MSTLISSKITTSHLERKAIVYLRQSTPKQVREHLDSQLCQRTLIERAQHLGWHESRVMVLDGDLGQSASQAQGRHDFKSLTAEVALGHVGIVFGWDVSRLARNNADWYQLLDLAAIFDTLIGDNDGIYDPKFYNDRLLLGLKGTMSEAELYSLRQRLNAGRLSKVNRGEYVQHLPTGLERLSNQKVVKSPDAQVRQVIELVFAKFTELGSARKVLRYCRDQKILLPRYQTSGFHKGELLWKKPSESAIGSILTNPAYAGAFVYGRRVKAPSKRKPGRHSTGVVSKSMEEWQCVIHDAYPAYISWEQYLENRARLKDNLQRYSEQHKPSRGAPGKGAALLQGLATCGQCGRRMNVGYKPGVRYLCSAMSNSHGEPMCAHLHGPSIEQYVVQAFFEAIAPIQLDALDEILQQKQKEQQQLQQYHQQQVQRAEYEVGLARRRYDKVDPDNRLVAHELERDWEDKLRQLHVVREVLERFTQTVPESPNITPSLRQQLSHLNQELPKLWADGKLTPEQKKQLLRSLIAKVLLKRIAPDQVQVKVIWVSGHFSEGIVCPPIWRQTETSHYADMVARIKQLWQQGQTDAQIADVLNQEGFHSARQQKVTDHIVLSIRHQQQWSSICHTYQDVEKVDGLWTIKGLAAQLGVKIHWIYNRIRNGFLTEFDLVRQPRGYYLIRDNAALMERLRLEANRTSQSQNKLKSSD
ncbi:recombinase family protein [soil metagenome]